MRIGIQRNVDKFGRVTIPKELREFFALESGKKVSIIDTEDGVLIFNPEKKKDKEKWYQKQRKNYCLNMNKVILLHSWTCITNGNIGAFY